MIKLHFTTFIDWYWWAGLDVIVFPNECAPPDTPSWAAWRVMSECGHVIVINLFILHCLQQAAELWPEPVQTVNIQTFYSRLPQNICTLVESFFLHFLQREQEMRVGELGPRGAINMGGTGMTVSDWCHLTPLFVFHPRKKRCCPVFLEIFPFSHNLFLFMMDRFTWDATQRRKKQNAT